MIIKQTKVYMPLASITTWKSQARNLIIMLIILPGSFEVNQEHLDRLFLGWDWAIHTVCI